MAFGGKETCTMAAASASDLQRLADAGLAQLREGDAGAARASFEQVLSAGVHDASLQVSLAYACQSLGDLAAAQVAADYALVLDPLDIRALMIKADCLRGTGSEQALAYYRAVLRVAQQVPSLSPATKALVQQAQVTVDGYATRFEDQLRADLAKVTLLHGAPSARFSQSVDLLCGKKQLYLPAPRLYLYPELPAVQFFDRAQFPWLEGLEAATHDIRTELQAVLTQPKAFTPYVQSDPSRPQLKRGGMLDNPDWSAYYLWKDGVPVSGQVERFPKTMAALAGVPLARTRGRSPSILFSLLRPGAHIPAHHGFINTRLIVHLPLLVPSGCSLRVGNETREWVEGRAWLFDDTIEHEAWNRSQQMRVILLFEVWRPELADSEIEHINTLFEAIDAGKRGISDWGI
jgi:aspartate beta-hydroxylase